MQFGFTSSGGPTTGALSYQGLWDANSNIPFLTSGVGISNSFYIVEVAGTTNLDGITSWNVGDWAIFNGTVWQQVPLSGVGISTLNGLSASVQFLIVGSGGTDFNIDSTYPDTHIFNIPTASATSRGLLDSSDFLAFNAKQNALPSGSASQYLRGNLTLATFPTALSSFTNDVGYITSATAAATYYPLSNPSGYISSITSLDVTTALGYTPYNSTNPSGYITSSALTPYLTSATAAATYYPLSNPSGYITGITSMMVTTALGYTPYSSANPAGYISSITSLDVTTALGYTPYNSTNPSGYITSAALSPYLTSATAAATYYPLSNPSGYITGITSMMVTTALGYTPYNSTNPSGYITSAALSGYLTSATAASTYVPQSTTITINGTTQDLTTSRSWTIAAGVTSVNTATGAVSLSVSNTGTGGTLQWSTTTLQIPEAATGKTGLLSSTDWNTFNGKQNALGYTPENVANKSTDTNLGTSNTLYPTQNAVKTYVDTNSGGASPKLFNYYNFI